MKGAHQNHQSAEHFDDFLIKKQDLCNPIRPFRRNRVKWE